MTDRRRAAFLDRDGTLIRDANYLADPDEVELLPGTVDVLRRLNAAQVPVVVVTNQSGIARGMLTEAQYQATRARLDDLLGAAGARVDATYHCPHHPSVSGPCDCRKPETGMYERAAAELCIDLARSLYVGDRFRDVAPGLALGGCALLVESPSTPAEDLELASDNLSPSLADAVDRFLQGRCLA
jgi:histidinol-phosphate phosphatase family protein